MATRSRKKSEYLEVRIVGSSLDKEKRKDLRIWGRLSPKRTKPLCAIKPCGNEAAVRGHVWWKRKRDHCYVVPLCKEHATNSKLDYPAFLKIKKTAGEPMKGNRKDDCGCSDSLIPGEVYHGQFGVTNVEGSNIDSGSKLQQWRQYTGLEPGDCQLHCTNRAEHGGHMWVKGRDDFCFILPICQEHNSGSKKFVHPKYKPTVVTASLMVRKSKRECGCPPTGCS